MESPPDETVPRGRAWLGPFQWHSSTPPAQTQTVKTSVFTLVSAQKDDKSFFFPLKGFSRTVGGEVVQSSWGINAFEADLQWENNPF